MNGIEVHRPLLIRAGQQEGLSFVNPDMTQTVDFSAGGFDARYTDKMASVLDITYKRPRSFESSVQASLLGLSGYAGFGNDRFTQMHGIRYKTSRYFLSMLPTKATYNPDFLDYQTFMTWSLGGSSRSSNSSKSSNSLHGSADRPSLSRENPETKSPWELSLDRKSTRLNSSHR